MVEKDLYPYWNAVCFNKVDPKPEEPTSFFYMSEDALEKDKLLILIHGNGVVRAGQWARRFVMSTNI